MKIEHIAIWTNKLELLKDFYITYFKATCNQLYHNEKKQFKSYFLSFDDATRLELMQRSDIHTIKNIEKEYIGYAHLAFSLENREKVNDLTAQLKKAGYSILSNPRITGDGYYESLILDPDGNRIEITSE